jgi:hypothetical protein
MRGFTAPLALAVLLQLRCHYLAQGKAEQKLILLRLRRKLLLTNEDSACPLLITVEFFYPPLHLAAARDTILIRVLTATPVGPFDL